MWQTLERVQGREFEREEQLLYDSLEEAMPIPNCKGLSREDWCKKEVSLISDTGLCSARAYVEFSKEWQCIDGRAPLGKEYVGVVVCEVFSTHMTLASHSLQRWPIKSTLYEGLNLYNQERKYNEILQTKVERTGDR